MTNGTSPAKLLLVEGRTDYHVVRHLRDLLTISEFCISERGNVDKVLDAIVIEIDIADRIALGILVDADGEDEDSQWKNRWESIRHRLESAGIAKQVIPANPDPSGTIIEGTSYKPRVGVWMMPNNVSNGEIEDFLLTMIPDNDPVWSLAQGYIDGIPIGDRRFKKGKHLRAQIHAWLAAREEPRQPGLAIKTGDLDINSQLCMQFTNWLRRLFS